MHQFDWSSIPGALPTLWSGAVVTFKITLIAIGLPEEIASQG